MKLEIKEIMEEITNTVKEVAEEIVDWIKDHKKAVIVAAVGYIIWKWFIKDDNDY